MTDYRTGGGARCKGCGHVRPIARFPSKRKLCDAPNCYPRVKREEWARYSFKYKLRNAGITP